MASLDGIDAEVDEVVGGYEEEERGSGRELRYL